VAYIDSILPYQAAEVRRLLRALYSHEVGTDDGVVEEEKEEQLEVHRDCGHDCAVGIKRTVANSGLGTDTMSVLS
jgi:hypothetical protein